MAEPLQGIGKPRDLSRLPFRGAMVLTGVTPLLMTAGCVYTRVLTDTHRRVIPGSIATMEAVTIFLSVAPLAGGRRQSPPRPVND
jgi:hypothetical protein